MPPTARLSLAEVMARIIGGEGLRFTAYDGSTAGAADGDLTVRLRTPRALAYLAQAPGSLGLARAYVAGDLELDGALYDGLHRISSLNFDHVSWPERLEMLRAVGPAVLRPVAPPPEEVRQLRGLRHSKHRDADAISHHYDVSNRFYEWVLGPSMAYTCAVYPSGKASLEQAQEGKFDLVARKLGLRPGMRLLDVGCGWGGMVLHAASRYGVQVVGVTLSRQQAEWGQKAIVDADLGELAEIRHGDYRDVREGGFDAVSSIGLTEHIGARELPAYFRFLRARLRPGGRLLNHCIMRPTTRDPALVRRGFVNRYVFPDGELLALGRITSVMQDSGFEVRHEENLREHYALTLRDWCTNLAAHWDEAVAEVGANRARVWALYLAGSRLAFERRQLELHQVLGVRTENGDAEMPLRPDWGV